MRQVKLSSVVVKTAFMTGLTFCVIPFFVSAHAQTTNNQAQILFEMQAMREELAELRDMVERQQYDMRKVQAQLQSAQTAAPVVVSASDIPNLSSQTPTLQAIGQQSAVITGASIQESRAAIENGLTVPANVNSLNNTLGTTSLPNDVLTIPSVGGVTQGVDSVSQTVLSTSTPATSSVSNSLPAVSKSGREYPPVVEINVGGSAANAVNQTSAAVNNTAAETTSGFSNIAAEPATIVQNTVSNVTTTATNTVTSLNSTGQETITSTLQSGQTRTLSALDIQPIETVASKPLVAIPSVGQGISVSDLSDTTVSSSIQSAVATLDPSSVVSVTSENEYYQRGFAFLKESKHTEAVSVFKEQISTYPKGDRADDAYYWIAESMYVNRKLSESKENFKAVIQGYPQSERLPDSMLKLAYIEQEQGNIIESRILLQEIMQFHPKSDAALSAKNRLAEIK